LGAGKLVARDEECRAFSSRRRPHLDWPLQPIGVEARYIIASTVPFVFGHGPNPIREIEPTSFPHTTTLKFEHELFACETKPAVPLVLSGEPILRLAALIRRTLQGTIPC
jgi:hypothetical protein